jgi:crossover junction endodeoxyribonuclease RusA
MIHLRLPYPPSINAYWLTSGRRKYISKRGVVFKLAVQDYVIEHCIPKLGDVDLEVDVILHPRSKKLMDIDNCLKAILDSCQDAGIFDDDSQVQRLTVERGEKIKFGGCQVFIKVKG